MSESTAAFVQAGEMIGYFHEPDRAFKKWRYTDEERPLESYLGCYDCGLPYRVVGDCVVDADVWEQINPTCHAGCGILCPNCMQQRIHVLGLHGVKATFF